MTLATFQTAFWHDLWSTGPDTTHPWTAQPGFAVYRNTVLAACVDNLLALHPAVRRLTGDDWLRAVALAYARQHPPADGRLQAYGEHLPAFLADACATHGLPWLPEVAQLDRLWNESHVAADAPSLDPAALTRLTPDTLDTTRLHPHPATRWRWCAAWPAFDLWQAARDHHPDPNPPHWQGQGALLTRPTGAVVAAEIGAGACALLDACAAGHPIPDACAAALSADPALDLGTTLGQLLAQGAFTTHAP